MEKEDIRVTHVIVHILDSTVGTAVLSNSLVEHGSDSVSYTHLYRFTGIDCDVKSVSVVGTKSVLASVSTLSVVDDKLNIEGATGDTTVELNLADYLPPSTSIVGRESYVVPVTLRVEPLASKEFTLSLDDVQITGMNSDYDYSFSEDDVTVTVIGLQEDLDTLEDTSLQPSMAVSYTHLDSLYHFNLAQ